MFFAKDNIAYIFLFIWLIPHVQNAPGPSTKKWVSESKLGVYEKGSVSTAGWECAKIGVGILRKNGSAVDSAIATLLCEGVASYQSMGLGGGFLMTIYNATTKTAEFLNARDMAPSRATEDMFNKNPELSMDGEIWKVII